MIKKKRKLYNVLPTIKLNKTTYYISAIKEITKETEPSYVIYIKYADGCMYGEWYPQNKKKQFDKDYEKITQLYKVYKG